MSKDLDLDKYFEKGISVKQIAKETGGTRPPIDWRESEWLSRQCISLILKARSERKFVGKKRNWKNILKVIKEELFDEKREAWK